MRAVLILVSLALALALLAPLLRRLTQRSPGGRVHPSADGDAAAVILLDLAMPAMDGNTFLERLVAQWEQTRPIPPIVVITAAHDASNMPTAYIKGVVLKPFHVRDLLDVVHNLMT